MPGVYDDFDLEFTWNGDFPISRDGDLRDTSRDGLQSLIDQLHDICASTFKDWEIYPNRGAGLDDYIGEPNTRTVGGRIHDRVRIAISSAGLVCEEDLKVRVVPVHIHKVLIILMINAAPTPNNNLREGDLLQISFVFDSIEQEVFFLDMTPDLIAT